MNYIVALAVLVVFLIFAFNNRFLGREYYGPRLGAFVAHWAGVGIQVIFIVLLTFLWLNWMRSVQARGVLLTVGVMWAVLATAVEFFAYHWVQRRSWPEVLGEYDARSGHGWWLVTLAYLLAPLIVHEVFFAG